MQSMHAELIERIAGRRREPADRFSSCAAFSLAEHTYFVLSESDWAIDEIRHHVSMDQGLHEIGTEIRLIQDPLLESACRQFTTDAEEIRFKPDFSYFSRRQDSLLVLSSALGFENFPHAVIRAENSILIIASRGADSCARQPLRVIRELMLRRLEDAGGCMVHGAVAARNRGAVLIVGDNGAGKTSTMCEFVRMGFDYIASDSSVITMRAGAPIAHGWPQAMRLSMGTASKLIGKDRLVAQKLFRTQDERIWRQTFDTDSQTKAYWGSRTKIELTPAEYADLTHSRVASAAEVKALLFPELAPSGEQPRLSRATRAEVELILNRNLRLPESEDYMPSWIGMRATSDAGVRAAGARIAETLLSLPLYQLIGDPRRSFPEELLDVIDREST
jgi:hypothetical protein